MGIFRPVSLIITNDIRIEPFGVHAWADVKSGHALLNTDVTIKNYSHAANKNIVVLQELVNNENQVVSRTSKGYRLKGLDSFVISNRNVNVVNPVLWSVENPYLYKIKTTVRINNKIVDELITDFGFRTINWKTASNQFYLNGKPVFINGVAEYEHLLGQSHAFSQEQVRSRVKWLEAAGFNAFRDGHQPHNLLYGKLFNEKGILWWTQLSAHVWYDTPEFKNNFKQLLKEWVIERRNDPSVVLWGLQNESKIPKAFAEECTQLIRSLDPTSQTQRLVTTCNGGEGTDWDVPQNWTGTYGGDPDTYGDDLKKQILVGEYGAWRTLDLHAEGGYKQNAPVSEDRFTQLMEKKIRLAESVKDSVAGHFFWLLTSHDNPGRVQGGEGLRELDRVGPVNYKMLTPWEEPTDVFYMFRSHYVSAKKEPMVYIASHTWPNRWSTPGIKDSIMIYSNCDEVELFNDIDNASFGRKKKGDFGTHFIWNNVNVRYNILYAVGYVNGKAVAKDTVILYHLPNAPSVKKWTANSSLLLEPTSNLNYIYRLNCGGGDYTDEYGNIWNADKALPKDSDRRYAGSSSWTASFSDMPAFLPVKGAPMLQYVVQKIGNCFKHFDMA
ncbi:glycoside hydrolase family 2 TIM barrel-domain containing protein [Niabella ginsengisoli]|uniref:Glycoside hydrolase family 2 protein n=1 Tax=Niabella ginsengisoli TaxID=522298 RepID=A0ABS9SK59_9BACT|nr:glycoside hydrolase family 2 TIM barrel-domain containing protein [Niabella ginsengisoli]MCH5598768.1 glycoside hydrolase family 2 protein [Niabella ginsengisoli]